METISTGVLVALIAVSVMVVGKLVILLSVIINED